METLSMKLLHGYGVYNWGKWGISKHKTYQRK